MSAGSTVESASSTGDHKLLARRRRRLALWLGGAALVLVMAAASVIWGTAGLELLSWLAGIGSLIVAVVVPALARGNDRGPRAESAPAATPGQPARPVPRELPPLSDIFVDRVAQFDAMLGILRRSVAAPALGGSPIVVISGLGGIGKTSLAVRIGHAVRDNFPDGQFFVDLAGFGGHPLNPVSVQGEFLRALGVTDLPERAEEHTRLYRSRLADGRFLIVLDNARAEQQVMPLLPTGVGSAVIVTSRSRLGLLDTSHRFPLDVLSEADSVALLGQVVGDGRVAGERGDAERIVRGCGGFPLALKVAAARLALRPSWRLASLASRLQEESQRLKELNMGNIEARAGFAFSYQNLTGTDQRLYRLIGLLDSATVSAWVAAALLDVSLTEAEELVERLAEADLIVPDGRGNYRMHDILRVFARERLAEETPGAERDEALGRVLAAYFALADEADGWFSRRNSAIWDRPPQWPLAVTREDLIAEVAPDLAWFDAERANLLSLTAQALSLGQWPWVWRLASAMWQYFEFANRWPEWFATFTEANQAAQQAADPVAESLTLRYLGVWARALGRTAEAETYLTQAVSAVDQSEPSFARQMALKELSMVERQRGRYAEAVALMSASIDGLKSLDEHFWVAANQREIGIQYRHLSRSRDARAAFTAAISAFGEMGEESQVAGTYLYLGEQERLDGHLDVATACVQRAVTYFDQVGRSDMLLTAVREMGIIQREQGRYADAIASFERCLAGWGEMDHAFQLAMTRYELARTYLAQGRPEIAANTAESARTAAAALDDDLIALRASVVIAGAELALGQLDTARQRLSVVLPEFDARSDVEVHLSALRLLARIELARGAADEAAAADRAAAELEASTAGAEDDGSPVGEAEPTLLQ